MPPTKFMTGNIFRGHVQDALFNMVTILTGQKIHLLGMMTEAIHTPFMSDRALSIENARYVFNTMKDLGEEMTFKPDGIMAHRADEVLTKAADLLEKIERDGLFATLERGHLRRHQAHAGRRQGPRRRGAPGGRVLQPLP